MFQHIHNTTGETLTNNPLEERGGTHRSWGLYTHTCISIPSLMQIMGIINFQQFMPVINKNMRRQKGLPPSPKVPYIRRHSNSDILDVTKRIPGAAINPGYGDWQIGVGVREGYTTILTNNRLTPFCGRYMRIFVKLRGFPSKSCREPAAHICETSFQFSVEVHEDVSK